MEHDMRRRQKMTVITLPLNRTRFELLIIFVLFSKWMKVPESEIESGQLVKVQILFLNL